MKLTVQLKLLPSREQSGALLETMEAFNAACNELAVIAFSYRCANKVELQKIAYRQIRDDFGLSAQMTVRAIAKVVEAYKRDRKMRPMFRPHGAIVYDERILSWKGPDRVSILTLGGREIMPWVVGAYQKGWLDRVRGQADLVARDGKFFLYLTIDVGDAEPVEVEDFLGIDLGLKNIAVDSDGDTYSGAHNANLRKRHHRLRRKLQKKGTKSAKRLLRARRRKETRYARDLNHRISKALVRKAFDTGRGIAVEDLTHIRSRTTVRKPQRRAHSSWAFAQLRAFLTYKSARAGIPIVAVDPRYTSQTCPCCGSIDRRNRPNRDEFRCLGCGHAAPADIAAAENIARLGRRHAAERRAATHAAPVSRLL